MKNKKNKPKEDGFWEDGIFIERVDPKDIEKKRKTLHKRNDEDMNFSCRKCGKKISAHNKDWHAQMCDECFNKTYFQINKEHVE